MDIPRYPLPSDPPSPPEGRWSLSRGLVGRLLIRGAAAAALALVVLGGAMAVTRGMAGVLIVWAARGGRW